MGLRERGKDTWQIVVYAGTDPATGKERRKRETFHGTKRAARDRERQLILDARAGKYSGPDITVKELLAAWLEQAEPDLAATTAYNYRSLIENKIVPDLGTIKLTKLTPARLDNFYTSLRDDLSPKTVRK